MVRRAVTKAYCYRVLVVVRYYPRSEPMIWWPVIAADSKQEAQERALTLYSAGELGVGLPIRGTAEVIEVRCLHATSLHDWIPARP